MHGNSAAAHSTALMVDEFGAKAGRRIIAVPEHSDNVSHKKPVRLRMMWLLPSGWGVCRARSESFRLRGRADLGDHLKTGHRDHFKTGQRSRAQDMNLFYRAGGQFEQALTASL